MVIGAREELAHEDEEAAPLLVRPSLAHRLRTMDVRLFDSNHLGLEMEKWRSWVSDLGLLEKARKLVRNHRPGNDGENSGESAATG